MQPSLYTWWTWRLTRETGKVEILRYTAAQDVGQPIHPSYVEGQIQGGVVQGIGWALNEEYFLDSEGRMVNSSFLDYRMPIALDVPLVETLLVTVPSPGHPYGARGVGEVPIVPPPRRRRERHPRRHRRAHAGIADVPGEGAEGDCGARCRCFLERQRHPAVDDDDLAADHRGIFSAQEGHRLCEVLRGQ